MRGQAVQPRARGGALLRSEKEIIDFNSTLAPRVTPSTASSSSTVGQVRRPAAQNTPSPATALSRSSKTYRTLASGNEYVPLGAAQQVLALPRDFMSHVEAKLVAEHELNVQNEKIRMRREHRMMQNEASVTSAQERVRQGVARRTAAHIGTAMRQLQGAAVVPEAGRW